MVLFIYFECVACNNIYFLSVLCFVEFVMFNYYGRSAWMVCSNRWKGCSSKNPCYGQYGFSICFFNKESKAAWVIHSSYPISWSDDCCRQKLYNGRILRWGWRISNSWVRTRGLIDTRLLVFLCDFFYELLLHFSFGNLPGIPNNGEWYQENR